jgi:hypothetical protein
MPGSPTTPEWAAARAPATIHVAFRDLNRVGLRYCTSFAVQWPSCALPCRRFALTTHGSFKTPCETGPSILEASSLRRPRRDPDRNPAARAVVESGSKPGVGDRERRNPSHKQFLPLGTGCTAYRRNSLYCNGAMMDELLTAAVLGIG